MNFCVACGAKAVEGGQFCGNCGARVGQPAAIPASAPAHIESTARVHGGFLRRFTAGAIDLVISGALYALLLVMITDQYPRLLEMNDPEVWGTVYFFVFAILYHTVLEGSAGLTPGKLAAGIRMVDRNGNKAGIVRVFFRNVMKVLTVFTGGLGFAITAFTRQRQAMHDVLGGTLVVARGADPSAVTSGGRAMRLSAFIPVVGLAATALIVVMLPEFFRLLEYRVEAHRQANRPLWVGELGNRSPDVPLQQGFPINRMQGGGVEVYRQIIESPPSEGRSEAVGR